MEDEKQPQAESEAAPTEVVGDAQVQLQELKEQADRYLANWQRAQADFVNYKRRTEQEREEAARFANAMLIASLLPVLDDLERAFDNVSATLSGLTWVEGLKHVYRKLLTTLEAQGLSAVPTVGADFDPRQHQAVMEGDGEKGKVLQELQKGYTLHDRVLRPAMVKVGNGNAAKSVGKTAEGAKETTEEQAEE